MMPPMRNSNFPKSLQAIACMRSFDLLPVCLTAKLLACVLCNGMLSVGMLSNSMSSTVDAIRRAYLPWNAVMSKCRSINAPVASFTVTTS